jgi:hypothetical protein
LITPERTRAVIEMDELVELADDAKDGLRTIDFLVTGRLLTVQSGQGRPTVEIVHESLITSWPTLKRWLDESEEDAAFIDQLQSVAKQWDDRGRPEGLHPLEAAQ